MSEDPPARANPTRGLALIATAVILGIFVLRQGFETTDNGAAATEVGSDQEEDSSDGTPEEDDEEGEDEGAANEEAEAPPEPLAPAELMVRVANTTGVGGAAGGWSDNIETNGYQTAEPTDAAERDLERTTVVHREELAAEASSLAAAIGEPDQIQVRPFAGEELLSQAGEPLMTEDVDLLILLGQDLADQAGG